MGRLQDEIQSRPFEVPEEEAMLSILRTAEVLSEAASQVVKAFKLTPTQYNVLRILRGAGPAGLPASEISSRMITRDPDITRLLHRLELRNLISRERSSVDRRVVLARITKAGLELISHLDTPIVDHHRRQLGHLGRERLRQLILLLEECRSTSLHPASVCHHPEK